MPSFSPGTAYGPEQESFSLLPSPTSCYCTDLVTDTYSILDHTEMCWLTFIITFFGSLLALMTQFLLLVLYKNFSGTCLYLLFLPLYALQLLLLVLLTVTGFRAVWYLLDVHYLPEQEEVSQLTGMAVGLVLLILLRVTSCLHPGVSFDHPR